MWHTGIRPEDALEKKDGQEHDAAKTAQRWTPFKDDEMQNSRPRQMLVFDMNASRKKPALNDLVAFVLGPYEASRSTQHSKLRSDCARLSSAITTSYHFTLEKEGNGTVLQQLRALREYMKTFPTMCTTHEVQDYVISHIRLAIQTCERREMDEKN